VRVTPSPARHLRTRRWLHELSGRRSGRLFAPPSSQSSDLVAGPDSLPAPAGRGPNALRLPAVRAVVSVIAEERPCNTKSTVVIVSKTVMLKVVRVKCVLRASTTDCADMISGEASTDTLSASAIAGKAATQMAGTATKAATASPAETATSKASAMAATHATTAEASSAVAAPTTHATTTPAKAAAASPAASKRIAGNACAR
jgi:hypothetical protein